jgi:hypothetical protein
VARRPLIEVPFLGDDGILACAYPRPFFPPWWSWYRRLGWWASSYRRRPALCLAFGEIRRRRHHRTAWGWVNGVIDLGASSCFIGGRCCMALQLWKGAAAWRNRKGRAFFFNHGLIGLGRKRNAPKGRLLFSPR